MDKLEDGKYEIGKGIVELNGIIFRLSFPEQGGASAGLDT